MIKVLVKEQTIVAAAAVGTYESRLDLGKEVKRVLGYYALIITDGGLVVAACKVSFSNSAKTIFEPVGLNHLIVSTSVPIKDRFFREEPFSADGGNVQAKVTIPAIPATAFTIQYVLLVETE